MLALATLLTGVYVMAVILTTRNQFLPPVETASGRYVGLIAGGSIFEPSRTDPYLVIRLAPRPPPVWRPSSPTAGHDTSGWEIRYYPDDEDHLIRLRWLPVIAGVLVLVAWLQRRRRAGGTGFPVGPGLSTVIRDSLQSSTTARTPAGPHSTVPWRCRRGYGRRRGRS